MWEAHHTLEARECSKREPPYGESNPLLVILGVDQILCCPVLWRMNKAINGSNTFSFLPKS